MERAHDLGRTPSLVDADVTGDIRGPCTLGIGRNSSGDRERRAGRRRRVDDRLGTADRRVFDIDRRRPAVTELPGVGDQVDAQHARGGGVAGNVAVVGAVVEVEVRHGVTNGEAGELDEGAEEAGLTRRGCVVGGRTVGLLGNDGRVSADHAVVRLGAPVGRQIDTRAERVKILPGTCTVGIAAGVAVCGRVAGGRTELAVAMVRTEIHANLEAGVGARDIKESRAIQAANLHVFDRLGLYGKVSGLRARHRNQTGCGAEKKAFHCVHSNPPVLQFGRSVPCGVST